MDNAQNGGSGRSSSEEEQFSQKKTLILQELKTRRDLERLFELEEEDMVRELRDLVSEIIALKKLQLSMSQQEQLIIEITEEFRGDSNRHDESGPVIHGLSESADVEETAYFSREPEGEVEQSIAAIRADLSDYEEPASMAAQVPFDPGEAPVLETVGDAEKVTLSAFAPSSVRPGATVVVQTFLHVPMQAKLVQRLALERDQEASRRGMTILNSLIPIGAEVSVRMDIEGIKIAEAEQKFIWRGDPLDAAWPFKVPRWQTQKSYLIKLSVAVNGAPVGRLVFRLQVTKRASRTESRAASGSYRPYEYVFCSYSSEDRQTVEKCIGILRALGVPYFLDVESLRAGDDWEQQLKEHLGQSDLVLLFWSPAAKNSKWVEQESLWACELQGRSPDARPDIKPYHIGKARNVRPPKHLKHLHFEQLQL